MGALPHLQGQCDQSEQGAVGKASYRHQIPPESCEVQTHANRYKSTYAHWVSPEIRQKGIKTDIPGKPQNLLLQKEKRPPPRQRVSPFADGKVITQEGKGRASQLGGIKVTKLDDVQKIPLINSLL